jgi:hypothetical protein
VDQSWNSLVEEIDATADDLEALKCSLPYLQQIAELSAVNKQTRLV